MSNSSSDRMRLHIRRTLLEMLHTHSIETITMKMLAEAAQINRSTIYEYYNSLFDVLGDCISVNLGDANHNVANLGKGDLMDEVGRVVLGACKAMREHPDLYALSKRYQGKMGDAAHILVLRCNSAQFYESVFDHLIQEHPGLAWTASFLPQTLQSVSGAIMDAWAQNGFNEDDEEITWRTITAFEGIIGAYLSRS